MKKVFLFLVCLFALQTVVMADDYKLTNYRNRLKLSSNSTFRLLK